VVPLSIPGAPGVYDVELDGVVEGRSWGSWLGIAPSVLRVERLRNGGLVWERGGAARRRVIRRAAAPSHPFRIPHRLYGANETERCVEIPWALSRYRGERRVLDVGYAYAEPRYLDALAALRIPFLVGIDLVAAQCPGLHSLAADVRVPALRPGSFDLALALSVIEHVGRDNTRYVGARQDPTDPDGDLAAIRALADLLAPGGRLLLTVPFGVAENHGWFVQYDGRGLERLIRASGLRVIETEFYRYRGAWQGPVRPRRLADCRYGDLAVAAAGVACVSLKRSRILPQAGGRNATAEGGRADGI
jgi:O-antigen chain-terminating methyltransferase